MKKHITIVALLAAGTAFANAAEYVTPTENVGSAWLTTTFTNADQTDATKVGLTNTWAEGLSGMTDVSASISSGTGLLTTNAAGISGSFLSPNVNVGSGSSWTETFSYDFGINSISLSTITINIGLYNSEGKWQSNEMNDGQLDEGAQYRGFDFDAVVTIGGASTTYSVDRVVVTGGVEGTEKKIDVVLQATTPIEQLTGEFSVALTAARTEGNNAGCYVGLNSLAFNSMVPIPEPSAFGLLAGLGALALVGTRRRRRA